jgi:hypothetical protein
LVGNPEENKPLGTLWNRWKNNIKMELKERVRGRGLN